MYFAHPVNFAAVEKHALRQCGLAGVNMGNNADVADAVDVGHDGSRAQGLLQHAKGQATHAEKIRRKAGVQPKTLAARRQGQARAAGGKGFAMQNICLLVVAGSQIKGVRQLRIPRKRYGRAVRVANGQMGRDACGRVQSFCLGKIQGLKINAEMCIRDRSISSSERLPPGRRMSTRRFLTAVFSRRSTVSRTLSLAL